ncbi:hypothetical protein PMIN03_010034 [Paraphaeosphaeria minitans]|uniref:ToxD-like zinc binding oxidoreductase n=1 Tax=Paraphaeosphaeria minitans TaxID=565426 RepID=A0A9P6GGV5_9PLEO|nr:putative toxD-like zinc binding oxidoreductase [Paraphaeosphaeria minitans]
MKALVTSNSLISRLTNLTVGKNFNTIRAQWKDVPKPDILDNEILVKVRAVALNATDFKHIDAISPAGCIVGCDFAGEVCEVGRDAANLWKIGDRVAGAVHGGLYPDRGSFAEYLKTDSDLAWKIPEHLNDAAATTYGVSAVTAMLALSVRLGLPHIKTRLQSDFRESTETQTLFVYAGSTSAGLSTIQLAKALGYSVVTTASPHSFELVKRYGAKAVFNYREPNVGQKIAEQYPEIRLAVDCFSEGNSTTTCDEIIGKKGGRVITLLPTAKSRVRGVEHELIMAYTVFGHAFQWLPPIGPRFPAKPSDREALAGFYAVLPQLTDILMPLPTVIEAGGFDAIFPALEKLREGKVSGCKLVVEFP